MDRIQYFISEKEKKKMEELNTMEQQTEEATTVIDEVTESIGENEPDAYYEPAAAHTGMAIFAMGAMVYVGCKATEYIAQKVIVPLAKKGIAKVRQRFSKSHGDPKIVEAEAIAVDEEDSENFEAEKEDI